MKKIREKISIRLAKKPGSLVVGAILLFNILFLMLSAFLISNFSLSGTEKMGFFEAAFYTITMILDAGCIQFVIDGIGRAGVALSLLCLAIIIIGMVTFSGAVIGYITNYISNFIHNANDGNHRLHISNHVVILNWNNRASEIVNDLLYCQEHQNVVVLVKGRKNEIESEINERLSDTIQRENAGLKESTRDLAWPLDQVYYKRHKFKNNISVVVKEGDVFSSKQLHDVSLERAKTIIILGKDKMMFSDPAEVNKDRRVMGDAHIVKTLMQVADITAAEYSDDNQKIVVEVEDDWTWDLVQKVIQSKQVDGKCNIVPVKVNQILGQLLSQFAIMPELNQVYRELFSNKGAAFYSKQIPWVDNTEFIESYLPKHYRAIPLTIMESGGDFYEYFTANEMYDIGVKEDGIRSDYSVSLNRNYWLDSKNVIILGHNSKCRDIMNGFHSFYSEWSARDREILRIVVIDDAENLRDQNYYRDYPFVVETIPANVFEKEIVCSTIERVLAANRGNTSIMILSDDSVPPEDLDANALANLIYVQDILGRRAAAEGASNEVDVIVEIIDPKHYDVVSSYSVNNVVISNRYISKMVTQIGEKEALFKFYTDILTYDEEGNGGCFESKEIYVKDVSQFFSVIPEPCTAAELIRAVYSASVDPAVPPEHRYPTIMLGYCGADGKVSLFGGDQTQIKVALQPSDKLVVFSNH